MAKDYYVKTVFDWDHFALYLSGTIDFAHDGGKGWREVWSERLVSAGFKPHQIFNPCKKPLKEVAFDLDDEAVIMRKLRDRREWSELTNVMSQIVHVDLRLVDKSDLILVNMPKLGQKYFHEITKNFVEPYDELYKMIKETDLRVEALPQLSRIRESFMKLLEKAADIRTPTYGTIHEMVIAHQQRKPIFLVWEGGKDTCSSWLMWLVGKNQVFATFDELFTRLVNMSKGRAACNAREWLWLDLE